MRRCCRGCGAAPRRHDARAIRLSEAAIPDRRKAHDPVRSQRREVEGRRSAAEERPLVRIEEPSDPLALEVTRDWMREYNAEYVEFGTLSEFTGGTLRHFLHKRIAPATAPSD